MYTPQQMIVEVVEKTKEHPFESIVIGIVTTVVSALILAFITKAICKAKK